PALEHAHHRLEGSPPGLRLADVQAHLVGRRLRLGADGVADGLEEAVLQRRGPPRRPQGGRDPRRLQAQARTLRAPGRTPPPAARSFHGSGAAAAAPGRFPRRPAKCLSPPLQSGPPLLTFLSTKGTLSRRPREAA